MTLYIMQTENNTLYVEATPLEMRDFQEDNFKNYGKITPFVKPHVHTLREVQEQYIDQEN